MRRTRQFFTRSSPRTRSRAPGRRQPTCRRQRRPRPAVAARDGCRNAKGAARQGDSQVEPNRCLVEAGEGKERAAGAEVDGPAGEEPGRLHQGPRDERRALCPPRMLTPLCLPNHVSRLPSRSGAAHSAGMSVVQKTFPARLCHGLEPGMDAQRREGALDVVSDRVPAESEPVGDLFGRAALRQVAKHFTLARRQMRGSRRPRLLGGVVEVNDAEDTDDPIVPVEGDRADLASDRGPRGARRTAL